MSSVLRLLLPVLSLAFFSASMGPAAEEGAATPPPVLTATETSLDAGEVLEGAEPRFRFTLVNNGTERLKLDVRTSCGCAVARMDPEIAPGGRSALEVTFKTVGFRGRQTKAVIVRADDAARTRLDLKIAATVRPVIRVEPPFATYVVVRDEGPTTAEFTLTPEPGQGVEFTEVISSVPWLEPLLSPAEAIGAPRKLTVTFRPDAPIGHLQGTVTVVTTSRLTPRINLLITSTKGISVSPALFYLGQIPENASSSREEILLTKRGGPFRIKKVESDDPHVQVTVEPLRVHDGSQYRLIATYTGGRKQGPIRQMVTVTTDNRLQPILKIPVEGVVGAPNPQLEAKR